ncbi:MAG: prepilin-type N-terminal cleavage/methylation domain-containing protein [Fibrobacter sp.]|nr:prepilin-type N-terminal cleavage/methylation domain-containing protein [Fibrobacter sp.]MDY6370239.1 prepilin-type N-terminal cleavage/methylation domain-containing protein [Fibrobacter sp.]MDY6389375.1 prepilin-type N-terminal cleavage/methylation domain-containing protein [Fibrobacter sp.]
MSFLKKCGEWKMRRSGFTLIEVMVVVVIIGILAGVGVPKLFGLIEKTKEKNDQAFLFYIRDAFDKALVQEGALSNFLTKGNENGQTNKSIKTVTHLLNDKAGMIAFQYKMQLGKQRNIIRYCQGDLTDQSAYQRGSLLYDALAEVGLGSIISSMPSASQINSKEWSFQMFNSQVLNDGNNKQIRIRFKNGVHGKSDLVPTDPSIMVWIGGDFNDALKGKYGTCFSTEPNACK